MAEKRNVPILQYAFFCEKVIEEGDQLTFKGIIEAIKTERPMDFPLTLVLGLQNIAVGTHKIKANCITPFADELLKYEWDITLKKKAKISLLTYDITLPVKKMGEYFFTILFDENPIIRLRLDVLVLQAR